jgi:hypothetical protein
VFLREELFRVLVVVPITSFLPLVRGLLFLPFGGGSGTLLQSQQGVLISVHCGEQAS